MRDGVWRAEVPFSWWWAATRDTSNHSLFNCFCIIFRSTTGMLCSYGFSYFLRCD